MGSYTYMGSLPFDVTTTYIPVGGAGTIVPAGFYPTLLLKYTQVLVVFYIYIYIYT